MTEKINVCVPIIGLQSSRWYVPIMERIIRWQWMEGYEVDFMVEGPTTTDEAAEMQRAIRFLAPSSAIPSVSKNIALDEALKTVSQNGTNDTLTSHNRNILIDRADGEWVFFIDYDTVPPEDALPKLLSLKRAFCGGVYYHRNDPHMPLLYWRNPATGLYGVIADFERGALIEADATGMGCTLIHRRVFDDIKANYRQFSRPDGSRLLVHNDDVRREKMPGYLKQRNLVVEGDRGWWQVQEITPTPAEVIDSKPFPYFEMEHERTEDLGFCERARRVGYEIAIDTTIECEHWHMMPITGDDFRGVRDMGKLTGNLPSVIGDGGVHGSNS